MKHTFSLLISFLLVVNLSFAQISFIPHIVTYGSKPHKLSLADIDNDNDLDILAFYVNDKLIAWHRNDGMGHFDSLLVIDHIDFVFEGGYPTDINNDGNIDVLVGGKNDVRWYENTGNGNFGLAQIINNTVDKVTCVFASDLDNDSLTDVIAASYVDSTLAWYKNIGNGIFGPKQILTTNETSITTIDACDLDLDGKTDILFTSFNDNKIAWYKNLGSGSFGPQQIIANTSEGPFAAMAVNLDSDSLADVISSQGFWVNNKVTWQKNLGNGNFSSEITINGTVVVPKYFFPADFDNDNDSDLLITSWNQDSLIWQENLGNGIFGPTHLVSDSIDGPYGACAGDLNGDGLIDIVAGSEEVCEIDIYLNKGTGLFELSQTISYSVASGRRIFAEDLNNDGNIDILATGQKDNKVAWYKNLGNKTFSFQKEISNSVKSPWPVYAADLDNDCFKDVISTGWGDTAAWFKNLQNDYFDDPNLIQGTFGNSRILMAKDLDGDSLIDVIGDLNGNILWEKNLGNGNFGPPQLIGSTTVLQTFDVNDINGDGYLDVVFSDGGSISVSINNGTGNFIPAPGTSQSGAGDLQLVDLNDDGFKDIIFTDNDVSNNNKYVGWYPNDGLGNFDTLIIIANINSLSPTIAATDIDNDGDKDIFIAPLVNNNVIGNLAWFENLGSANFGPIQNIDLELGMIWDIYVSDFDNDFDDDIVLTEYSLSIIKWLENTLNNLVDTVLICAEDSALIFGNWVSQPGDYTDTLLNAQGGDSINIIRLENYPSYLTNDTVEICEGETYNFYGQVLNTAGVYSETFQSVQGCDSIEELMLVVIPAPAVSISPFAPDSVSIDSGLLALPTANPAGGIYSGTGVTASGFDPALAGLGEFWISYTYVDTITGCTNQDSTWIKVYDPIGIEELETNKVKLFPNPGMGNFVLTGTNLQSIQVKTLTGELVKEIEIKNRSEVHFNLTGQAKGIYFVHIVNDDAEVRRLLILM